jgi:hypothetical protein
VAELLHHDLAWAGRIEAVSPPDLPVARRLAEEVLAPRTFPTEVIAKTKTCLLDFLSCAFEARDLPWSRQACDAAVKQAGAATIIGTSVRATPSDAVFANAVLGHGLVREDMHTGSVAHLGVVVWPTVLVAAETRPVHGADLLAAAITGYEIGGRVGRRLMTADLARVFRPTGLVGPLAAAAAGARLSGRQCPCLRGQYRQRPQPMAAHRLGRHVLPSRLRRAQRPDLRGAGRGRSAGLACDIRRRGWHVRRLRA